MLIYNIICVLNTKYRNMRRFKNFNLGNLKNASHSGKISFVYNYVTKLYRSGICNEYYYFIFLKIHFNIHVQLQYNLLLGFE